MKIQLICVGKTTDEYLKSGENNYLKRLKHYCQFEKIDIPELKKVKGLSKDQIKAEEAKLILKHISNEQLILLDETGEEFNSRGFSKFLQKRMNQGGKGIVFLVGGAYGFAPEIRSKASHSIALSKLTFTHQMVRLIFMEQLYRGFTILNGEPYHHD